MRFFFDNCTSPYHVKGIAGFGELQSHVIIHLRDRFAPSTEDNEWISVLGSERDWIIVSGDTRITRNPAERHAWHESGLTGFFFAEPWQNDKFWTQCTALVGWWPEIVRQARETPRDHGFILAKNAKKLRQIYPGTSS